MRITPRGAGKIRDAVAWAERQREGGVPPPVPATHNHTPQLTALCTDGTPDADGNFPGLLAILTADSPEEWEFGNEEVRLRPLNGGLLIEGNRYPVRPSHTGRTSGRDVYVTTVDLDDTGTGTGPLDDSCSITVVTNVCPVADPATGYLTGVEVEYSAYDLSDCPPLLLARWCQRSPSSCCPEDTGTGTGTAPPPVSSGCCPGGNVYTTMPVEVSWEGGTLSGTAYYNGGTPEPIWSLSFGPYPGNPGAPDPVPLWGAGYLICDELDCAGGAVPTWKLAGLALNYNTQPLNPLGPQWSDRFGTCNAGAGTVLSGTSGIGIAATLSEDCDAPCLRFLLTPHPSNPVTQQPILLTVGQGCPAGTGTGTGTGGGANIYSVGLGTVTASAIGTVALPVSWDAGEVVVLTLAWRGEGAPSSVLLDGTPMLLTGEAWNGLTGATKQELVVYVSDPASSSGAGSGNIDVSMSGGTPSVMLLAAEAVGGLPVGEADPGDGSDAGSGTAVSVSGSLSAGDGYIHSCALLSHATSGAEAGVWAAPTGDGQTESVADGGLTLYLRTGERVATAAGGYTAAMETLADPHDWLAVLVPLY